MYLRFRRNAESKKLPESVQNYLRRQFMLEREYIEKLRYFEIVGLFREQPVRRIRVFSPALAKKNHLTIRSNSDLELHPEILVFEGHIDAEDKIYFADRRTALRKMGDTQPGASRLPGLGVIRRNKTKGKRSEKKK
jgi:hypothetical protein